MVPSDAGRFHIAYIVVLRGNVKAVVQRVSSARVRVGERIAGEIGPGLCILLGVARGDEEADAERLAAKVARLRIFENDDGRFDRSLLDTGGEALVVSQFTLIADTAKGNRPSFTDAAPPEEAEPLYDAFCKALRGLGVDVATGEFGARMAVELLNDGPVTIILERGRPRPREAEAAEEDP
jgi:D-tyrosyl-tRNA(Tyr) deacylase